MPEIVITESPDNSGLTGEVEPSWQELLDAFRSGMAGVSQTLERLIEAQATQTRALEAISNRVPENLTQTLQAQQETITRLVGESMQTVRTLLTPPAEPAVIVETPPAEPAVEVAPPEVVAENQAPPVRKRRTI